MNQEKQQNLEDQEESQKIQEINVVTDTNRLTEYNDLGGMTIKRLEWGLWWANNSKFIKAGVFWFLMAAGLISWIYTLFNFLAYIGFGMNEDNKMLYQMVQNQPISHNYLASIAPVELVFSGGVETVTYGNNKHDLAQLLVNQNSRYFATFDYYFKIGEQQTKKKSGFILANEQKYLIELGYEGDITSRAQLVIENLAWQKIDLHKVPDWQKFYDDHLTMKTSEPVFSNSKNSGLSEKMNIYLINFAVSNVNPYNYFQVPFQVLAYYGDQLVGMTSVYLDNFKSGETRVINISYPYQLEKVDRVEVVPDINIMRDDIYEKFTGTATLE